MLPIGVNTFLWASSLGSYEKTLSILSKVKKAGFDAVQIPILDLDSFDAPTISRALSNLELKCFISAGLRDSMDITADNPSFRKKGVDHLKGCVEIACRLGAPFLSGSFHSVFGKRSREPINARHWSNASSSLKIVAREARVAGLNLVLEPINRYESFLVNTADQAKKLIAMIGEPNVKIQLDTFHMNIEEDDFYDTISSVGTDLMHFHVAESHRGRFGTGQIPWDQVFSALRAVNYGGAIIIESFTPDSGAAAVAACIWRTMAASADALVQEGLVFIKDYVARYLP